MTPSARLQHVMEIRYQINLDAILKEQVGEQYDKQRSITDQILSGLLDRKKKEKNNTKNAT